MKSKAPGGGTVVQLGDLVENGGRTKMWDEIDDSFLSGLDTQYAGVKGNHETYEDPDYNSVAGEPASVFTNMFALPKNGAVGEANYSFDRGQVHFSVLSSTARLDDQLSWLVKDVRASDKKWNVVLGHYSYYGGRHGADAGMDIDREKVTRVLDQLGVDLYIGGHDHVYKRSTIYDGRLARTPEETAEGTTFVTMGSAGPKFYDNAKYWWDDKVDDEDVQMGGVLTVTDAGLRLTAYKIDGRPVDDFTVTKPQGTWKVSSAEIRNRELDGVGLLSSPGSLDKLTVTAATYDASQQKMIDVRSADVTLDHRGREQYVRFGEPLAVAPSSTVKLFVWDSLKSGKPLRPAVTLREGLAGDGTAQTPYLIDSADDLAKIDNDPAGHYKLAGDLNLSGLGRSQIGRAIAFTGVLDGAGHTISGLSALSGQGPGLFADNHGTIENLVVNGDVTTDRTPAGLVADINHGTIERVRADGSLTAASYAGGITGHQFGIVRDSVSTVNVKATTQYVGGVVGVAMGGSVTQNVLATGSVTSAGASAGGIAAYGYDATEVSHSVALNSSISGTGYAHAIVGRVLAGQTATLEDNHVSRAVPISGQTLTDPPAAGNQRGNVVSPTEIQKRSFYEARGWDFTDVWQWSETGARPTLKVAPEPLQAGATPQLPKDDRGFYVIKSADDLTQIGTHLSYDYVLGADLDLSGRPFTTLPGAFTGELDGAGHTIKGLTSAGGLFTQVSGNVHDLAITDAKVTAATARAGILAGASTGTVERVWVSGSVTAASRAGGLLGDSQGVVRDVYSTADVRALSTEAGGVIGVALAGSLTERVFATGAVRADTRNVGGVAGYGYTGTTIRNSIALNPTVTAPSWAHRFLGRVLAGNVATLEGNWAVETVEATTQQETTIGPATLNGATVAKAEARGQDFWTGKLGFDLTTVWKWDEDGKRPVLRAVPEDVPAVSDPAPTGPPLATPAAATVAESAAAGKSGDEEGAARTTAFTTAAPAAAEVAQTGGIHHEAVKNDDGTVTVTVSAGAAAAAGQLSFLLLKPGAAPSAPAEDDIAYLGEVRLDDQGNATLTVLLDQPDGTMLALNTSGDTERHVAPLLPRTPETTAMRVLHDTVTATVKPQGNAPAQATITLVCTGADKCQEEVAVSHDGRPVDAKKVTLQPGKTRDLKLNLRDEARAALLAGRSIILEVRIGTAPAVQVTVTP
ncbi:metallophosphoesterase [Sphaerisporangium krabiense]|uniref:metallophosphoesterase n=1 Tax=Sphaerisporangium krabiense TaxID=763782 RepID=UPI001EF391D6|nr:metallophosphoesterase [Sphaerisporangium krabiense]